MANPASARFAGDGVGVCADLFDFAPDFPDALVLRVVFAFVSPVLFFCAIADPFPAVHDCICPGIHKRHSQTRRFSIDSKPLTYAGRYTTSLYCSMNLRKLQDESQRFPVHGAEKNARSPFFRGIHALFSWLLCVLASLTSCDRTRVWRSAVRESP